MKKHQKLDLTTQIIQTYFYVFPHAALQHFISGFPNLLNPNLALAEERHIETYLTLETKVQSVNLF